ncbi:MAG TPA: ribulose-phosphate 3-epimerase [Lachnospiraceae bacterium]|nr:ribulose-phosphate 3-epimerase [Lachnospiraceae bacterium]
MSLILSPSLLSADFTKLGEQIRIMEKCGTEYFHVDVMDGIFVPNISIGIPVIKSLRGFTDRVLDVHLMIDRPERYIEAFANAGSDIINIHIEACSCVEETLKKIRELGKSPALTIKPKTSWKETIPYLHLVDMVLVMSVEPGFGGQSFIESTLENVKGLYSYKQKNDLSYDIEIDGGINKDTLPKALEAGVNIAVAGSAILSKGSIEDRIAEFNEIFKHYE